MIAYFSKKGSHEISDAPNIDGVDVWCNDFTIYVREDGVHIIDNKSKDVILDTSLSELKEKFEGKVGGK